MTSCFVYKVMRLTFHDRINTQLIYRIEIAQVVARRITKPQRTFLGSISLAALFIHFFYSFIYFFYFFFFFGGGRVAGLILLFSSCLIFFLFIYFFIIFCIPLTCIRYIYKNFCNNTSYCKFGNTRECEH